MSKGGLIQGAMQGSKIHLEAIIVTIYHIGNEKWPNWQSLFYFLSLNMRIFFFPWVIVNILPFPWEHQTPGVYNVLISIEFSDIKNKQLLVIPRMNNTGQETKTWLGRINSWES